MQEHKYAEVDPKLITVKPDRQRQDNIADIADLQASIGQIGLLSPIIVRTEGQVIVLVAGERRLKSCLALAWDKVPVRYFSELSSAEAEIIELEENLKRSELSWKDNVKAVARIHAIHKAETNRWTVDDTAKSLSVHSTTVHRALTIFKHFGSDRIAKCDSADQAYNTIQRFAERRAEAIVGQLVVTGGDIFDFDVEQKELSASGIATVPLELGMETRIIDPSEELDDLLSEVFDETVAGNIAAASSEPQTVTTSEEAEIKTPPPFALPSSDPIICMDFSLFAKNYSGPKFNLIHCDFPYGNYRGGDSRGGMLAADAGEFYDNDENVYWKLLDILTSNLDRIMSYSAHMIFWFNMNFYTETVKRLRQVGLFVFDHPLIWHKTGGAGGLGVVPGGGLTYPRRTYDTALLAVRGNRPPIRSGLASYAAPTVGGKIHPSQKPEPMLRQFLTMYVDETTRVLDPTCGSGAALRAAEELGAEYILGLELDPAYATLANTKTLQARILRKAGQTVKEG